MQAKRSLLCTYLRTAGDESTPTWSLIGEGFTTNSISYEPDSEDNQYINMDSATTTLKRYKPTMSLEGVIEMTENKSGNEKTYTLDPVFDYVNQLRRSREVTNESELLIVELYTGTLNIGANVFEGCSAQRQKVNMQVEEFGGEAGETISFSATINFQGDPTDSTSVYDVLNTSARTLLGSDKKVTVTYTVTNCTATNQPANAYKGADLTVTVTPSSGYHLPDTITVESGTTTLVANTDYSYNKTTGKIVIKGSKITGNLEITCTGAANA